MDIVGGLTRGDTPDIISLSSIVSSPGSVSQPSNQQLEDKIVKAKKRIQEEQRRRDENVEEYLKMAAVAQRHQLPQVKAVFEKKNRKAAANIAALQKKIAFYGQQLKEREKSASTVKAVNASDVNGNEICEVGSEASGPSTAASKGRLYNLKDGISGISGTVIAKPRKIATRLLKNNRKSGSLGNIFYTVARENYFGGTRKHYGSAQILSTEQSGAAGKVNFLDYPPSQETVKIGEGAEGTGATTSGGGEEVTVAASESCSESVQSSSQGPGGEGIPQYPELELILQQIYEIKEEIYTMREDLEEFKNEADTNSQSIRQRLQEERFRAERLEEQVNDLMDLHQEEVGNLKRALADAEEKLSYQSEERLRDLAEMLEACQTKISRLEHQQHQFVPFESIENSTARALIVRLVNVGLTILQILLLLVATIASALAPFLGSRKRILTSILVGICAFVLLKRWPQAQELFQSFGS